MKIKKIFFINLLILIWLASSSYAIQKLPKKGYINDYVGILKPQDISYLSQVSKKIDLSAKTQIVLVVVESMDGESIEEYANKLFEEWGIGYKENDRGILFITSINDRKVRIEVGYGLEHILTDGRTGEILDQYVLPLFKKDRLAEGVFLGHLALSKEIANAFKIPVSGLEQVQAPTGKIQQQSSLFVELLLLLLFMMLFANKRTRWLALLLIFGGFGRGSRSSFGSFGGSSFGGFGGGLSGGGGASRGW